jgi:hypothetical protein
MIGHPMSTTKKRKMAAVTVAITTSETKTINNRHMAAATAMLHSSYYGECTLYIMDSEVAF